MTDHRHAVFRQLHIDLAVICHFTDCFFNGCHGIFRCVFGASPVGCDLHLGQDRLIRRISIIHHIKNHESGNS